MRYLPNKSQFVALLLALSVLPACSTGRQAFSRGESLEAEGKYEEAMYSYADAFRVSPGEGRYRAKFLSTREIAGERRFSQGAELLKNGEYAAAIAEFQTAYTLNPTMELYRQKIDEAQRLRDAQAAFRDGEEFEKGNKFKEAAYAYGRAVELNPERAEYLAARKRISTLKKNTLEGFELQLKSTKPITLKFKDAKLKDVFNIVTRLSGINFVFDEGVKDQPVTVYLENATFHQALDLMTNMFKLNRKVLNESTVIIYPKTPDKVKQYEDMAVRTFHLNHIDVKKAVNLIRGVVQVRKLQANEDANSLLVRDTPDVISVVEKILDASDVPDPEVVLDVEVLEISDKDSQNLGLLLSSYSVQMGAFTSDGNQLASTLASATTSSSSTTTQSISNLLKAFSIEGFGGYVTVPSATYNFGKTLAKGDVLSNPKIRVRNKEKSKFTVGTRVPITTTSTTGTTGGYSVNVQYVDVGVKVNAEPTIQLNNEIVIKLTLEVSSIVSKETVGGSESATTVVTIGTRNLETVLSLKDGETSIIGGLIQDSKNNDKTKVYLLGDIPLIGPLLSSSNTSTSKTELLLAITPRLVRGVTVPPADTTSFMSGKEDDPTLERPLASFEQEPRYEAPQGGQSAASPRPATGGSSQAAPKEVPVAVSAPVNQKVVLPPEEVARTLLDAVVPTGITVGKEFRIDFNLTNAQSLLSTPFVLSYDPTALELISVAEGSFLKSDGRPVTFSSSKEPAKGSVAFLLQRASGSNGITGSGILASAQFKALKAGITNVTLRDAIFKGSGVAFEVVPFSKAIEVK